jgi:large subunit ribosomal protein L18
MARHKKHVLPYRRKREGKTDYRKRLQLLVSRKHRAVIRKSLRHFIVQIVEYKSEGDVVLISASSNDLKKAGWKFSGNNIPAAYLVGYLCGLRAKKKNIKNAIADLGLNRNSKGVKIYAAIKGLHDAGIQIPFSEDVFPSEDRINGKHIGEYAKSLQEKNAEKYNKIFSKYLKEGTKPEEISSQFESVKKTLEQS